MGLLDVFNSDEGKLGLSLLAAAAPSMEPMNFAGRLANANKTFSSMKDNDLKNAYMQAQTSDAMQQVELRKQQAAQIQRRNEMINGLLGQLDMATPGANQAVINKTGNLAPTNANAALQTQAVGKLTAGNPLAGIPRGAIAFDMATNDGKNIGEWMFKRGVPDMQVSNGYAYDKNSIAPGFLPGINIANDGRGTVTLPGANGIPTMSAMPGSVEAYGTFEDRKNQSAARADLVKVVGPDGAERYVPRATVLGQQPVTAVNSPRVDLNAGAADRFTILSEELVKAKNSGNAADAAAIQREIDRLPVSARTASQGFQATPTNAQSLSKEATGKLNESFIKSSYEPTLAAGAAANDMLTNVSVARQSMRNMGGTGWGTEGRAAAASVLSGLGLAPANAKFYAANAETFQNVAMSNLQTVLNAAKGPQTEGDADRASKTFAQLKNTPQANEFILDLAEAKAARDQMKAKFFQQALPIAQQKGDLQELEREWAKRAPSVFAMPSMDRWGKK